MKFSALLLLVALPALAADNYGQMKDAYGYIIGIYTSAAIIPEVCSTYPKLKAESASATKTYRQANGKTYGEVESKMQAAALANGGQQEMARLKKEVDGMLADRESLKAEIKKTASSERACHTMLENVKRGQWDIKTKAPRELAVIAAAKS